MDFEWNVSVDKYLADMRTQLVVLIGEMPLDCHTFLRKR